MRPLIRRMFLFALGGAFVATAWVWSLWAMIGTLPTEHGPARVVQVPAVEEIAGPVEPPAPPPEKKVPPPFRVKAVGPPGDITGSFHGGGGYSTAGGEFGAR